MNISTEQRIKDIKWALSRMPAWVKEKSRRYHEQKKLAQHVFGNVVKHIESK